MQQVLHEEITLRRSTRVRNSATPIDYVVYLQESYYSIGAKHDAKTFSQAISSEESDLWHEAMNDEMDSMAFNRVWDLVELPYGIKFIGCKWVFKTKKDSQGKIKRHKARLMAKGFTQREGINYTKTFLHASRKDSLRVIMTLVTHFDFELYHMKVKIVFLNGGLEEEVYIRQHKGFSSSFDEHLVCKPNKSIYDLK